MKHQQFLNFTFCIEYSFSDKPSFILAFQDNTLMDTCLGSLSVFSQYLAEVLFQP